MSKFRSNPGSNAELHSPPFHLLNCSTAHLFCVRDGNLVHACLMTISPLV